MGRGCFEREPSGVDVANCCLHGMHLRIRYSAARATLALQFSCLMQTKHGDHIRKHIFRLYNIVGVAGVCDQCGNNVMLVINKPTLTSNSGMLSLRCDNLSFSTALCTPLVFTGAASFYRRNSSTAIHWRKPFFPARRPRPHRDRRGQCSCTRNSGAKATLQR